MKKQHFAGSAAFKEVAARLHSLLDQNPAQAVVEARALLSDVPVAGVLYTGLKAGVLIDAGSCANDKRAIEEGIALFRRLSFKSPDNGAFHYKLGNGLVALADQEKYTGLDWYLTTSSLRREARNEFQFAVSTPKPGDTVPMALTNLGNALAHTHRWVEAYDSYSKALSIDPTNSIASTGAAKILLRCIARDIGEKKILKAVAVQHVMRAKAHAPRIVELAGAKAQAHLAKLLNWKPGGGFDPDLSRATKYEKFVAKHRLAISPTIEGLDCSLVRWDSLRLSRIFESSVVDGIPAIFAMLNVMKSDFLAARFLAFQALTKKMPESGLYADTLDNATYGVTQSMLTLAQRACMDVLDKIAVATTEYFAITTDQRPVCFANRWHARRNNGQFLTWHAALRPHIDKGNTALIALAELSLDVNKGGALHHKKALRHSSTHRFTVLHDIECTPRRHSVHVEHSRVEEFKEILIDSLQLVRAAILYFTEMIAINEANTPKGEGLVVQLDVPSQHRIRGDDRKRSRAARNPADPKEMMTAAETIVRNYEISHTEAETVA
jgi:tetratricopeptide (TPR) repeat protein